MFWLSVIGIVVGLAVLVALFVAWVKSVGNGQPVDHHVSRTLSLRQTPQAIWEVLTDHENEPAWQSRVKSVRLLPDRDGCETWEQTFEGMGTPPMTLTTTEKRPPRRLVRTISDAKQVFSGRWEYDIAAVDGGSRLTITEHGEIPNPFFRGMWKLFGNPTQHIEMYLKALAGKFGEPAMIE